MRKTEKLIVNLDMPDLPLTIKDTSVVPVMLPDLPAEQLVKVLFWSLRILSSSFCFCSLVLPGCL